MPLLCGLDLETTGLSQPEGDRIIEVAILTYDFDTRQLVDTYVQRIDPERNISAKAQEVHGIAYSELVGQPKWCDVAGIVKAKMDACTHLIAHNADFDAPFIGGELLRVGLALPAIVPFCTMASGRWATPNGKYPRLGELCFALNVEYDPAAAHAAEYDTAKTIECFWRGLDRGFYTLPEMAP